MQTMIDGRSQPARMKALALSQPKNKRASAGSSNVGIRSNVKREDHASTLEALPSEVARSLPSILRDGAKLLDAEHEKGVFISSAIGVLSGGLPNVVAEHGDGVVPININVCIQASAGSGKSSMKYARQLIQKVDERLYKTWKIQHEEWVQKQAGTSSSVIVTEPHLQQLLLGGNASERSLLEAIHNNGGRGVIFETEMVTLSKLLGSIAGDAGDLILKAFHHEPATISRKGFRMHIERPSFSVVVSGTPASLSTIINKIEGGLFSRFAFYRFDAPATWKSHRPGQKANRRDIYFEQASQKVDELCRMLEKRDENGKGELVVRMKVKQWNLLDATFEKLLHRVMDDNPSLGLEASVKRSAVIAFRIACLLTILRGFDDGKKLDKITRLVVDDVDAQTAITLGSLYLSHALEIAQSIEQSFHKPMDNRRAELLACLPDEEFSTAFAVGVGERMSPSINVRTMMRYLDRFVADSLLTKPRHGFYCKPEHRGRQKK